MKKTSSTATKKQPSKRPRKAGVVRVPVQSGASLPPWLQPIYAKAVLLDQRRYPYVFGGGHNPQFAPSIGLTDGRYGKGYDCSGIVDAALHAGGLVRQPWGTAELEHWGASGQGEWLTVWVHNGPIPTPSGPVIVNHCVLEFMRGVPGAHRFLMGHHTGGAPCGFASDFNTIHYHARRRAA
jgi:hypothetical protein